MRTIKLGNRKGQSLLELAMLLPFLFTIILGAVEYSNMFMVSLRASNLSRAVANAAFRDCAFLNDAPSLTCLSTNTTRVRDEGSLILDDFDTRGTVIATSFARDAGQNPPVRLMATHQAGSGGFTSRYSTTQIDPQIVSDHDRVIVGEIIYPYVPITPLGNFLELLNMRTVIYEVTIY